MGRKKEWKGGIDRILFLLICLFEDSSSVELFMEFSLQSYVCNYTYHVGIKMRCRARI